MTDSHATTLDTAMRAAWINAGWPTTANMPADPSAVLAELDARILQTAGHSRRLRMSVARGNLVVAMDAANEPAPSTAAAAIATAPDRHAHPSVSKSDVASLNQRYAPWRIEKTSRQPIVCGIAYGRRVVTVQARNTDTGEIVYSADGWNQATRGQALAAILARRDNEPAPYVPVVPSTTANEPAGDPNDAPRHDVMSTGQIVRLSLNAQEAIRRVTCQPLGQGETQAVADFARDFARDCDWQDESIDDTLAAMTPAAIVAAAARHYDGGMDAMVSDALADMSPRVHVFATGSDAYNASQTRDDIRRGDVLHVPAESAVAVMVSAWPTALDMSTAGSAFHALADGIDWHAIPRVDGSGSDDYSASADVARRIVSDAAVTAHEPVSGEDNPPMVSDAQMAPYRVQRQHSGSEDGWLYYVVDADGARVSDAGHVWQTSARADAADMATLDALTYGERCAVHAVRAQCPAPHDRGLAVVDTSTDTGDVIEYRTIDTRRPDSLTAASMLAMALDDYRGSARVSIVTDDGRAFVPAVHRIADGLPAYESLAIVSGIALDIAEIGAAEYGADARDAYRRRVADLRATLDALPAHVLADVPVSTLALAGDDYVARGATTSPLADRMSEDWLIANLPDGWQYDCTFEPVPAFTITAGDGKTLTIPLAILR